MRKGWIGFGVVLLVCTTVAYATWSWHRSLAAQRSGVSSYGLGQVKLSSGETLFVSNGRHDVSGHLSQSDSTGPREKAECDDLDRGCGTAPPADAEQDEEEGEAQDKALPVVPVNDKAVPANAIPSIEQRAEGKRDPAQMVASFDGLGFGFTGPKGETSSGRNPSDNSLAIGPDHIVQIVNSRMAVFSKKGKLFDATGKVVFGPVVTNSIFAGFGGQCENRVSGDAVVRYDQLANRWLFVLPIFRRPPDDPKGPYSMCYAVSQGTDPAGPYFRYEFKRPLFPDYPRPAIWPDGYYIPSSTGDNVIQKHACIADRTKMLAGQPATEQCLIVEGAGFFNNADVDGQQLPPAGAPNPMLAAGGSQLKQQFEDDGLYAYQLHVDWADPTKTALAGPVKLAVAPYHYMCNGQLTKCVPQPGTETRLDAQGDKIMQRLVYRRFGKQETILAEHSINTQAGTGGVRWYEFRLDKQRQPKLYQQGTYAPDGAYRWLASMAMDKDGNVGVGYSYQAASGFVGQRFTGRLKKDPSGQMTMKEAVLAEGAAAQTNTLRWEDYTTTAVDPSDDCTLWYVGDYLKAGGPNYSTRIGAFRLGNCARSK